MYKIRWNKMDKESGAGGEGEAAGGPAKGGDTSDKGSAELKAHVDVLSRAVTMMATAFDEMKTTQSSIAETLVALKPAAPAAGPAPLSSEAVLGDTDLSTLDNAGLAKLLTERIAAGVEAKLAELGKTVDGKMTSIADGLSARDVKAQVDAAKAQYKDLFEWGAEIKQKLQANPSLGVNDAYILVRSANPTKMAEMEKKYNPPVEEKKSIFSLTPGGGGNMEGKGKMKPKEAASSAFDDIFGSGTQHLLSTGTSA